MILMNKGQQQEVVMHFNMKFLAITFSYFFLFCLSLFFNIIFTISYHQINDLCFFASLVSELFQCSLWQGADTQNVSFQNSLQCPNLHYQLSW